MKSKVLIKVVAAVLVIGGGVGYFIYQAMQSSWSYYYSVDELAKVDSAGSHSLRIAGRVKLGSVKRDLENVSLAFTLAGAEAELPVKYKGVVPDNFSEDREVVVEGRIGTEGVFNAKTLVTRCESKYKVKVN
jgi:cytochrome c-type biogenesis protein CcmE